ncbi:MAG: type II secretion system protein GspE [Chitinivibrionales bacterium]|nr:type II secretion system protein GspE [Chitinivibrionales bacterium]
MIHQGGLQDVVTISHQPLTRKNGLECDIAVAVFDVNDDIQKYVEDVTFLKIVRKIPAVFAVLSEGVRAEVKERIQDIATDDIVLLPISPQEFGGKIMTHVVSMKIENEKRRQGDFSKSQQLLGELLVENSIISPLQLRKALEYQKGSDSRLGDVLVMLGYISEEQKLHFLSSQLGMPLATPRQYASADLNVVALVPESLAKRFTCIALERDDTRLTVAMADVLNLRQLDTLRDITDMTIVPALGTVDDINTSIERYYTDISSQKDASDLMADLGDDVEYLQQEADDLSVEEAAAAGAELGIIKLVNMLIANAVRDRASDIHIEPMEKELTVRYRIDGELRKVISPPKRSHQAIITRIKILSDLDIAERRLPQDGRMVVKIGRKEIDIRVSILPSVWGEKAVLRILDKEAFERSTSNLGFTPHDLSVFKQNITKPYGMIVVTGPTGSGKSTTLYSAIQTIKSVARNIVTVEDPVEFHMEGITQVQVNNKIGLNFSNALRSILRQDPDVVLIGEIRDAETADIAIKMSLTGHLVLSTLHTNDAAGAIARFTDIGVPPLLIGSALSLIIAQRLVRRICPKCRANVNPPPEMLEQLKLDTGSDLKFYSGEGCVNCNGTGYMGRTGIFEMIDVSKGIRTLILRNAPTLEIQRRAEQEGMKTLRQAGIELALKGETTIEQVIAATTEI